MLALHGTSPFSSLQCVSLSVSGWVSQTSGAWEWQMEAALWPLEIGKPFCPLLIECLTTGRSPHVKQPYFMLSQAAPTWLTWRDSNVRSWQLLSSASTNATETWWMTLLSKRLDHYGAGLNANLKMQIRVKEVWLDEHVNHTWTSRCFTRIWRTSTTTTVWQCSKPNIMITYDDERNENVSLNQIYCSSLFFLLVCPTEFSHTVKHWINGQTICIMCIYGNHITKTNHSL